MIKIKLYFIPRQDMEKILYLIIIRYKRREKYEQNNRIKGTKDFCVSKQIKGRKNVTIKRI